MAIGSAAGWLARRPKAGVAAGAAIAGGIGFSRGLMDGPGVGDAQELMFGDRRAVQGVVRGSASNALTSRNDVMGIGDSYYSRAISGPRGNNARGVAMPVGGEIVFGQYNLRRQG